MKIKLIIPRLPESGNKIQNWHYHKRHKYNEEWYKEVYFAFAKWHAEQKGAIKGLPLNRATITFTLYFPDRRKRDKDNYIRSCKPIQDALVRCGILRDDDWDSIETKYRRGYDKETPRTEIEIKEI